MRLNSSTLIAYAGVILALKYHERVLLLKSVGEIFLTLRFLAKI